MKKVNIAVLGATGAVGQEMLKVLEEYDIPVGEAAPPGKRPQRRQHDQLPRTGRGHSGSHRREL